MKISVSKLIFHKFNTIFWCQILYFFKNTGYVCSSLKRSQPVCSWGTGARMFPKNTWQALGHVPHAVGRASLLTDQHCRTAAHPLAPCPRPHHPSLPVHCPQLSLPLARPHSAVSYLVLPLAMPAARVFGNMPPTHAATTPSHHRGYRFPMPLRSVIPSPLGHAPPRPPKPHAITASHHCAAPLALTAPPPSPPLQLGPRRPMLIIQ